MSKKKITTTKPASAPKAKTAGDTTTLAPFFPAKVAKPTIPMIAGKGAKQKAAKETAKSAADDAKVKMSTLGTTKSRTKSGRRPGSGMSGLDAAAKVLADAGKPLTAQEMVDAMTGKGLWRTSGKTPHATIYAAIIREIAKKGSASRFRKTERGHFTVAKAVK